MVARLYGQKAHPVSQELLLQKVEHQRTEAVVYLMVVMQQTEQEQVPSVLLVVLEHLNDVELVLPLAVQSVWSEVVEQPEE